MSAAAILGAILTALLGSSIVKPSLYVVWIRRNDGSWEVPNPAGNRKREVKALIKEFVSHGVPLQSIMVLPLGAKPPQ